MSRQGKRVSEFTRLTEPHQRQLYGIAMALCRDPDQAADLTQEALIRAFEAFDRFDHDRPVLPWLRRILRNIFLDSFKTGRARHEVTKSELAVIEAPLEVAGEGGDPLAALERAELSAWVREEISALDTTHQQVLELCVMQGLAFAEAAEIAGIPVGTIASRLARARAQLRRGILRRAAAAPGGRMRDEKGTAGRMPCEPSETSREVDGASTGKTAKVRA